eukprot:355134-Chlamydomonas_euryale.AAC.5
MGVKASKIAKTTPLAPPPAPGLALLEQPSIVGANSPVALLAKVRDEVVQWMAGAVSRRASLRVQQPEHGANANANGHAC